ncbi:ATP-binding cassette domain-containing protein [Plantactinospora solaniradicis]|uniref:ATP-binding cassette domain-containing protein n=1 Tax=Plantactinospora solaniradicis TaxID=1723736 RepID=A0ABW1K070_9ACTN
MTSVPHTRALTKLYGRRPGVTDADLDIPPGRVVGLAGPSGAGMPTLLGMTCGLLEPTAGTNWQAELTSSSTTTFAWSGNEAP